MFHTLREFPAGFLRKRLDRPHLGNRWRAQRQVSLQVLQGLDEVIRDNEPTQSPPCHAEKLGE